MGSPILERLRREAKKELKKEQKEEKPAAKFKAVKEEEKLNNTIKKDKEKKSVKSAAKKASKGKTGVRAIKAAAEKKAAPKKSTAKKAATKSTVRTKGTEIQTGCGFFYTQHLTAPKVEKKENIKGTPYYITNHGRVYSKKNNGALRECVTLIYGRIPIADLRASGDRVRFKIADKIAKHFSAKQAQRFAELNNDYILAQNKKRKSK